MESKILEIKKIERVTHDVLRFTFENSEEIDFVPGQATEVSPDKEGWREDGAPFSFTSLPDDSDLELTIKIYAENDGITDELAKLEVGDNLILKDVFGAIRYRGRGTFIAGGAGVTPFISILRDLKKKGKLPGNRLIYANEKERDIINKHEFEAMLGDDFRNILSHEQLELYSHGYIDTEYLRDNLTDLDDYFYICGPEPMMAAVESSLKELGVDEDQIIREEY